MWTVLHLVTHEELGRIDEGEARRRRSARRRCEPPPEFLTAPYRVVEVEDDGTVMEKMWSPGVTDDTFADAGREFLP